MPVRRPLRRLSRWLGRSLLLGLILVFIAIFSLRSMNVRQFWLSYISNSITTRSGLDIEIGDFDLSMWPPQLEVIGISARSESTAAPFLVVERAVTTWRWIELLPPRPRLRSIDIVAPQVDLEAPLPASQPTTAGPESPDHISPDPGSPDPGSPGHNADSPASTLDLGFDIASFRIVDGAVLQQWEQPRGWLAAWRLLALGGQGAYEDGELSFEGQGIRLETQLADEAQVALQEHSRSGGFNSGGFDSGGFDSRPIAIDLRLHGHLPATFVLEELTAEGQGLSLRASGRVDPRQGVLQTLFDLDVEPRLLLPGTADDAGPIRASGDLDLLSLVGHVDVDAERLPVRLLEPWIAPETYRQWVVRDSFLTTQAEVQLAGARPEDIRGRATFTWQGRDETLVEVTAKTVTTKTVPPQQDRLEIDLTSRLLPSVDGDISFQGRLSAPGWKQLTEATIDESLLRIALPRPLDFQRELQERWPALETLGTKIDGTSANDDTGPWILEVTGQGPLLDPTTRLQFEGWQGKLTMQADGRPMQRQGKATLHTEALELASLTSLVGQMGRGQLDLELQADLDATTWQVHSTGTARSIGWQQLAIVESVRWTADLAGTVSDLQGDSPFEISDIAFEAGLRDARWSIEGTDDTTQQGAVKELDLQLTLQQLGLRQPGLQQEASTWHLGLNSESNGWSSQASSEAPLLLNGVQWSIEGQGQLATDRGLADLTFDRQGFDALGLTTLRLQSRVGDVVFDPQQPAVEDLHLLLTAVGPQWTLDDASLRWGDTALSAEGQAHLDQLLDDIHLEARLESQDLRLSTLQATADVQAGVLRLHLDEMASDLGTATIASTIPLANLGRIPSLQPVLASLPIAAIGGPLELEIDYPEFDSAPWLELLQQPPSPWRLQSGLMAQLSMNLAHPEQGSGDITLRDFRLHNEEQQINGENDIQLRWQGERLDLLASTLLIGDHPSVSQGSLALAWQHDEATSLPVPQISSWSGNLKGDIDLPFLTPYLPAGTQAEGSVAVQAQLEGSPEAPQLTATVDGTNGRLLLTAPYSIEVSQPRASLRLENRQVFFENVEAKVNDGRIFANGHLDDQGDLNLRGVLDSVRLRVDFGVIAQMSGNFDFHWPSEGRPKLASNLLVERAMLRRNIDLDSLLLSSLFAPPEIAGVENTSRDEDDIELDLSIATVDGLRVRNNLANLRATWSPIHVRGSMLSPLIQGDIDGEPGGLLSVYGQTLRLDQAQITFPGVPGMAPIIELATTSSLEDPTIGQGRSDLFASQQSTPTDSVERQLASGLATYYGNALASRLGSGLGSRTRLSIRPVLIFGESDPEARLTLSRDLSANLALAAAVSLQDTQRRTYVLDVHNLPQWPAFVGQAFTNEQGQTGVTLQHSWEPGKAELEEVDGTLKLRQIDLQVPNDFPARKSLLRTIDRAVGERLDEGADFDVEIDVAEALQRLGYSAADVQVELVHRGGDPHEVDLVVVVEPGMQSEVLFTGTTPPRGQQGSIVRLYRPNITATSSFEEMERRTRRVLWAQGYSDPRIYISRQTSIGADGRPLEKITVDAQTEHRLALGTPIFLGVEAEVAEILQQRFTSKLQRMELARGTEAAQQRVLASLQGLGFVEPQWLTARYDTEQKAPVIELEVGLRRRIANFAVHRLDDETNDGQNTDLDAESTQLEQTPALQAGSPLRLDVLSQAALGLESRLRNDGYSEARVTPSVAPNEDNSLEYDVIIEIAPGPAHRLREVQVSGQQHTREGWVRRIADLPEVPLLRERDITLARRRLLATGIFSRAQILRQPADTVEDGTHIRPTDLLIDVQEKPRFRLSSGLRWESSEGASAVFELLDRSFTRRGSTLGLRGLIGEQERSFRIYTVIPRVAASRNDLELFVEQRWEDRNGVSRQRLEGSFQLSRRLGLRSLLRFYGSYREGFGPQVRNPTGPLTDFQNPFLGVQWVFGEPQPDKLFPDGAFSSIDLSSSSQSLGAEQDFVRLFSNLNYFYRRPGSRWVWGQSLRFGWADASGEPLIDDLRFRTGGEYSVRGYSTDSLGPRFETDQGLAPLGGEALLVLNQELRFPVWDALAGLVFFDIGNVWDDKDDLGRDLATSLGVGVRYASPVGPLRFDVAYPLDRRPGDAEVKLYFGFGNIF